MSKDAFLKIEVVPKVIFYRYIKWKISEEQVIHFFLSFGCPLALFQPFTISQPCSANHFVQQLLLGSHHDTCSEISHESPVK